MEARLVSSGSAIRLVLCGGIVENSILIPFFPLSIRRLRRDFGEGLVLEIRLPGDLARTNGEADEHRWRCIR